MSYHISPFPLLLCLNAVAQVPPGLAWQGCYGGSGYDSGGAVASTENGDLYIASYTQSNNGQVSGNHGGGDIWVVKLDEDGGLQWQRCLGGSGSDSPAGIHATSDGGAIVIGTTSSNDGDVGGNHGSSDAWAAELNGQGVMEWQRCYGGSGAETIRMSKRKSDGNIVLVGSSRNANGDVTSNAGSADLWVVEIDAFGDIVWQRSYGGPGEDTGWALALDEAGGLLALGIVATNGGLVQGVHGGNDIWAVRISATGDVAWQRCLGGTAYDWGFNAIQASNDDWLVCGMTESSDGDVEGHHAQNDAWLIRLNDDGGIEWQRPIGGTGSESFSAISELADGSILLRGSTDSSDGDIQGAPQLSDGWLLNVSADGSTINWQALYGGSLSDGFFRLEGLASMGLVIAGSTSSNDGDVSGNHGDLDTWLARITPLSGITESDAAQRAHLFPNPCSGTLQVDLPGGWLGAAHFRLLDAEGRLVTQGTTDHAASAGILDLSTLPAGLYNLVVQ